MFSYESVKEINRETIIQIRCYMSHSKLLENLKKKKRKKENVIAVRCVILLIRESPSCYPSKIYTLYCTFVAASWMFRQNIFELKNEHFFYSSQKKKTHNFLTDWWVNRFVIIYTVNITGKKKSIIQELHIVFHVIHILWLLKQ